MFGLFSHRWRCVQHSKFAFVKENDAQRCCSCAPPSSPDIGSFVHLNDPTRSTHDTSPTHGISCMTTILHHAFAPATRIRRGERERKGERDTLDERDGWLNRSCHTSTKKIMVFIANSIPAHIHNLSAFSQRQHARSQHQKSEPTKLMSLSVQAAQTTRSPSLTGACSHFWFLRRNAVARCRFWHPQAPHDAAAMDGPLGRACPLWFEGCQPESRIGRR